MLSGEDERGEHFICMSYRFIPARKMSGACTVCSECVSVADFRRQRGRFQNVHTFRYGRTRATDHETTRHFKFSSPGTRSVKVSLWTVGGPERTTRWRRVKIAHIKVDRSVERVRFDRAREIKEKYSTNPRTIDCCTIALCLEVFEYFNCSWTVSTRRRISPRTMEMNWNVHKGVWRV